MKKLTLDDVLDLTAYEKARPERLARIIERKRPRRVAVGEELTFVFENRETALFQIQEMLRAERIVDDAKVQAEVDVYNEFVPDADELRATLMIEIADRGRVRETLDRLVGIDEHVALVVDGRSVAATFDPKQFEEDRISAVQYVRFPLGSELAGRFRDAGAEAVLRVDHPQYRAETRLDGETRRSLIADLESS
ncbi:MAG: DUF3501 family protein [Planctomycetota bacterium JB042]